MSLTCIGSLVLVVLCASYSISLAATEATRLRQRKNRLRGVNHQAVQTSRQLKKRQYYTRDSKGLEGFVLECEVQLRADFSDGFLSHNDYASFLFDYCEKSDYPGPACQSTNSFWSLDPRLQMIFASEDCDVGPKEQINCLASLRAKGQNIGYTGDTEKLCESTYRFLKPSGIVSPMLRNDDFTDSPDGKKKKKKGTATKVAAGSFSVFSSEPTQEPKLGRDTFLSPSAAPTIYTPPAFVEGIIKPGVLGQEEQHQGWMASKRVSFGFGATIILMLVGTVLVILLVRRFQFNETDNQHMLFDPALEGDASILSDNSFMFGERKESRPNEGILSNDSRESNPLVDQKGIHDNATRFWQLSDLTKTILRHFRAWKNGAEGASETIHSTPDQAILTFPSTHQTPFLASDDSETDAQISSFKEGSVHNASDDVSSSTLMKDEYYMNEFLCEVPEVVVDISSPSAPSSVTLEPTLSSSRSANENKEDSFSQATEEIDSNTLLSMRPNLASFVQQMKAQLEISTNKKDKCEAKELSSNSSERASVKFTVDDLKSQFESKRQDEENSTSASEDKKPAAPTVKALLSQFQMKPNDNSTSSVDIASSSNDGTPSVKNLRGQFEPPSRRNKRRTIAEMSDQLQELRKQFE